MIRTLTLLLGVVLFFGACAGKKPGQVLLDGAALADQAVACIDVLVKDADALRKHPSVLAVLNAPDPTVGQLLDVLRTVQKSELTGPTLATCAPLLDEVGKLKELRDKVKARRAAR